MHGEGQPVDRDYETQQREREHKACQTLREELREAVGEEAAERAERRGALDEAIEDGRPAPVAGVLSEARIVLAMTFFIALIAGAAIALVSGVWWIVFVALALHAIGTLVVVGTGFTLSSQQESPDPRRAAALEARGVRNPDAALDHAVRASEPEPERDGPDSEGKSAEAREAEEAADDSPFVQRGDYSAREDR